ncbi:anti-sigma factor [Ideonella sp. DXS29W]|uniref:Anti-sigma factor n=1 Tax=Ideonella lacteola TaxID=2984193 RepID=A0ABU9BU78_9BURK
MNYLHPPRLEALARDYAVGTLRGRARRRFERVLADSAVARQAVGAWQDRLGRLAEVVPPAKPGAAVWDGIETRLFGGAARPAVVQPPAAPDRAAPRGRRGRPIAAGAGGIGSLGGRWLGAGLAAGLLAGSLLTVAALRWQPPWAARAGLEAAGPGLPASYVGILSDAEGGAMLLASSRRHGQVLTIKWLKPGFQVPDGQVAHLWALPRGGGAPVAVGALPGGPGAGTLALPQPSEALFSQVERLAVSLEPASAEVPTAPSAPFLAEGPCAKLW